MSGRNWKSSIEVISLDVTMGDRGNVGNKAIGRANSVFSDDRFVEIDIGNGRENSLFYRSETGVVVEYYFALEDGMYRFEIGVGNNRESPVSKDDISHEAEYLSERFSDLRKPLR